MHKLMNRGRLAASATSVFLRSTTGLLRLTTGVALGIWLLSPEMSRADEKAISEEAIFEETIIGETTVDETLEASNTREAVAPSRPEAMRQLNQQFSAGVIIPAYQSLTVQTARLAQAGRDFEAEPTEANLSAARAAWLDTASAWAASSAFAFGPVHSLGYSAALEFPSDEAGIETLLRDPAVMDAQTLADLTTLPSLQGFDAIAYLLNGASGNKSLDAFTAYERLYLRHLTTSAHAAATELLEVWQTGWDGYPPYETLLATAGQPGNSAYLSVEAGSEEIVRGIVNCLDVVANEELPALLEEQRQLLATAPDLVTLQLLNGSLQSVQTAYLGSPPASTEKSVQSAAGLTYLVTTENEIVDQQIRQSLDIAANGMANAIADPSDTESLALAQASLFIAYTLLNQEVLPMVQGEMGDR
ncbi:MAG: imelysin family protein [Cyanobacteria bacterium P01_G01_bin.38]